MGKPYVCLYKLLVTCSVKNFPKVQMFNDINTQGARPITSNLVPRSWNVIGEASKDAWCVHGYLTSIGCTVSLYISTCFDVDRSDGQAFSRNERERCCQHLEAVCTSSARKFWMFRWTFQVQHGNLGKPHGDVALRAKYPHGRSSHKGDSIVSTAHTSEPQNFLVWSNLFRLVSPNFALHDARRTCQSIWSTPCLTYWSGVFLNSIFQQIHQYFSTNEPTSCCAIDVH